MHPCVRIGQDLHPQEICTPWSDLMPLAQSADADIHYELRGDGPPIMLFAGTGYSGRTWHPSFLETLAARHSVITFDHRGTGDSSRDTSEPYTTRMFGLDALAVQRAAGAGPVHVVSHSMGGRVAQKMYFEDPSSTASIVFGASGAGPRREPDFDRVGIPVSAALQIIELGYADYIRFKHRENFFTDQYILDHKDEVEWLDKRFLESGPSLRDYLRHVHARQAHSAVERLHEISVPTLILVGTQDTRGTASHLDGAYEMKNLLPSAQFRLLEGAKHGLFWENRDETAKIVIEFVAMATGAMRAK